MVQESTGQRQDAPKQPQSPFDLHKNELLVKAAELTGQYGVDLALLVSTPTGQAIKYTSTGPVDATLKRLQEMPVSDVLTRDQVVQHWQAGDMPTPPSQWPSGVQEQPAVTGQWQLAGSQAGWLQLAGPQRGGPSGQPQGQAACVVPALRAPGFLDAGRYPVAPAAEAAYRCLSQELDRLTEAATAVKRRKLQEQGSSGMQQGQQAASGSGQGMRADTGAAGLGTPQASVGGSEAGAPGSGGLAGRPSRFKPLSVELPGQPQAGGSQPAGNPSQQGDDGGGNQGPGTGMLALPSPSAFLTSGPQSLDIHTSTRGAGQQGHNTASRQAPTDADFPPELADTPNSSTLRNVNGFILSPAAQQEGGAANAGSGRPAGGAAPELMVLGKGLDANSRLLADSKGQHPNAGSSANLNALGATHEDGGEARGAHGGGGTGADAGRASQSGQLDAARGSVKGESEQAGDAGGMAIDIPLDL